MTVALQRLALSLAWMTAAMLPACKPQPDPVAKSLRKGDEWCKQFSKLYPRPIGSAKKPPLLGRTGDMGITSAFEFILLDFPKSELPALETWLRGKMKSDAITKVVLHGLFPAERFPENEFVNSETIFLHANGRREERSGSEPTPLRFEGKPIPTQSP